MDKLKTIIITVLATLGVLFIIILLIPDDEEDDYEPAAAQETVAVQEDDAGSNGQSGQISQADEEEDDEDEGDTAGANTAGSAGSANGTGNAGGSNSAANGSNTNGAGNTGNENDSSETGEVAGANASGDASGANGSNDAAGSNGVNDAAGAGDSGSANTSSINIPESELSGKTLRFKTSTLDDKAVSQDIFSDYDLTLVHVWGTYCGPCIAEIGEYGSLYEELPDNVNLVGIIVDVYDGINTNVSQAHDILDDNDCDFVNLRVSDDVYSIISGVQFVPSSFFVDSEGHMVGELMDGAGFKETHDRLYGYLK